MFAIRALIGRLLVSPLVLPQPFLSPLSSKRDAVSLNHGLYLCFECLVMPD
jgi:hypothetical protein